MYITILRVIINVDSDRSLRFLSEFFVKRVGNSNLFVGSNFGGFSLTASDESDKNVYLLKIAHYTVVVVNNNNIMKSTKVLTLSSYANRTIVIAKL